MQKSLTHLPQNKQDELANVVLIIKENCLELEKIILFGSYARGTYKEKKDLDPMAKTGHISDYDILVVTTTKDVALDSSLWKKISDECRNLKLSADLRIITHDIEALNIKLAEGQYFYSDIKKEGILIYDSGKFELVDERELTGKEKHKIAKEYFDHWFPRARGFYEDFGTRFAKININHHSESNGLAAFYLHQAAEHCYKTMLLVFDNYNPQEHFLGILTTDCIDYSTKLKTLFPQNTIEEKDRFRLLDYSYIGGRYDPDFRISKEDLEILAIQVKKLLQITEEICIDKISSLYLCGV